MSSSSADVHRAARRPPRATPRPRSVHPRPLERARCAAPAFTDWHEVRDTITDQTQTNTIIIGVNTLLALIAVGFTVATVISGRVLAQRREIGLLKAVGFTPRGVVALLVGEYARDRRSPRGLLGLIAGTADRAAAAGADVEPAGDAHAERLPARARCSLALVLIVAAVALFTALPAVRRRPPEHRRRARARPRLALGRRVAGRQARRGAQAARRPPGSASRTRSRAAPAPPDHRRAGDDGDHARRRAVDGGDLSQGDRRPRPARQAVGRARRVRRDRLAAALRPTQPRRRARDDDRRLSHGAGAARRVRRPRRRRRLRARSPTPCPDGRMFARPGEAIAGRGFYERARPAGRRQRHAPRGRPRRHASGWSAVTSSPTTTAVVADLPRGDAARLDPGDGDRRLRARHRRRRGRATSALHRLKAWRASS